MFECAFICFASVIFIMTTTFNAFISFYISYTDKVHCRNPSKLVYLYVCDCVLYVCVVALLCFLLSFHILPNTTYCTLIEWKMVFYAGGWLDQSRTVIHSLNEIGIGSHYDLGFFYIIFCFCFVFVVGVVCVWYGLGNEVSYSNICIRLMTIWLMFKNKL